MLHPSLTFPARIDVWKPVAPTPKDLASENWNHGVLVRGMSTPEGAHPRAKYNLHTGYREGQGGLSYPSLGALTAKEIGD